MIKILLADDDAGLRRVIQFKLQQRGYNVTAVENGDAAFKNLENKSFDLLLTDMKMPGLNGIELLEKAKILRPDLEVILITAYAEISQAVSAMKLGAFDYLTKPFEDDELFLAIEKAIKFKSLQRENKSLKKQLKEKDSSAHIIGNSKAYRDLLELVDKIAPTDATVLLTGESGTGKEVLSKLIHSKSNRSENRFIAVNCAAIPKDLIESELFGHVKGSFTGAVKDKKGKFELADNGTLFLDEISELNIELQAKLLRAIQERTLEPVGSENKIDIDIRLIAASNRNLQDKVAQGQFREDLFYRLNVIPIHIPPLRERKDDIPIFVRKFIEKFQTDGNLEIDDNLMQVLSNNKWPGNVRELENLIERMVILRKSDCLTLNDLPPEFKTDVSPGSETENGNVSFHDAEKQLIENALEKTNNNKSKAAELLKIPRHVLVYRLKKHDLFYKD